MKYYDPKESGKPSNGDIMIVYDNNNIAVNYEIVKAESLYFDKNENLRLIEKPNIEVIGWLPTVLIAHKRRELVEIIFNWLNEL